MLEPKKKTQPLSFDAQADSLLAGLRLTSAMLPPEPQTPNASVNAAHPTGAVSEIQPPEPALVSKLINFIKSI
jgi:hypothetical protein